MNDKEMRQQIVVDCKVMLEQVQGYIVQFETFLEDHLADNNFQKAATDKDTLEKLTNLQQVIEDTLASPTDANIERFIAMSAYLANYSDEMAKE